MSTRTDIHTSGTDVTGPAAGAGCVSPPDRDRRLGRAGWLLAGAVLLVLAAAVSVAVQLLAARLPVPPGSHVPTALVTWGSVVALALAAALFLHPRLTWWVWDGLAATLLSGLAVGLVALPLHGTYYYLGGLSTDQSFRIQYLNRLTDSVVPSDMNYADIPPFYPSGWFWLGGRAAALLDLPAWTAYKPLALLTLSLVPVAVYWAWSRLAGRRVGLTVGLVVVAASLSEAATEPYAWAAGALLPVAAVLFWRNTAPGGERSWAQMIAVGLFIGGALGTYTLYGGFGAITLCVLALWASWLAGPGARRTALARAVAALVVVGTTAALVALPVWAPYMLSLLRGADAQNLAARYLPPGSAELPDPMLDPTPWGALLAAGFGYALWQLVSSAASERDFLVPLAVLIGCCYAWYALSTLTLGLGTTLLAFRLETVLLVALGTAGVFALRRAWQLAQRQWPGLRWSGGSPAAVVVAAASVIVGVAVLQGNGHYLDNTLSTAYTDPYPTGPNAEGQVLDQRPERWVGALAEVVDARTTGPARDVVVLTTNYALLSVEPYRGFQQATPHYANPLADYVERSRSIQGLTRTTDSVAFERRLAELSWDAPSVFVLRRAEDGMHLELRRDVFPDDSNVAVDDLVFDPRVFAGWSRDEVGPYTVYVRPGA